MDTELRELLQRKADEIRLDPGMPPRVRKGSRRRRVLNAVVGSTTALAVIAGAFIGVRTALNDDASDHRTPATTPTTTPHEVWFTYDHKLFMASADTEDTPRAALQTLLAGPTDEESGANVTTAIPEGTQVTDIAIMNGLASVSLSTHVETDPLADAQVVYTLTQFTEVKSVLINDQEGGPLSRADLEGQLPAILVEHPMIGEEVTSPVTISGTADVFEATVSIRILDETGGVLADTYTTASCGSGCRGDYSKIVPFTVDHRQPGMVMVFEASAKDGTPINVVTIPVTMVPSSLGTGSEESTTWIPPESVDATDPDATALAFASQVLGWNPSHVHLERSGSGDELLISMWDEDMTSTFTPVLETRLRMHRGATGWVVLDVTSGFFEVTCPSPRQDAIVTSEKVQICGTFTQPPSDYVVRATLEYAESNLSQSEAQSDADIPVQGQDFQGSFLPIATYANSDVTLQIRVVSGSGHTLALWARRYAVEIKPATNANDVQMNAPLTAAAEQTRSAIITAVKQHDYNALAAMTGPEFEYGFIVKGARPASYFEGLQRNGELDKLVQALQLPHAKSGDTFIWPTVAEFDFTQPLSPEEGQAVDELMARMGYDQKDLTAWKDYGAYTGLRVGIHADGTWAFLVSGAE